jgi:uncharacterized protein YbcI
MPDDVRPKIEQKLAEELLEIHVQSYGKGAASARVYFHDDLVVALLDDLELLPNEQFLIQNGEGDGVVQLRGRFQQAIETTFRAAVERVTGRETTSFASITRLDDPNYAVEIFRLGERRELDLGDELDG